MLSLARGCAGWFMLGEVLSLGFFILGGGGGWCQCGCFFCCVLSSASGIVVYVAGFCFGLAWSWCCWCGVFRFVGVVLPGLAVSVGLWVVFDGWWIFILVVTGKIFVRQNMYW